MKKLDNKQLTLVKGGTQWITIHPDEEVNFCMKCGSPNIVKIVELGVKWWICANCGSISKNQPKE